MYCNKEAEEKGLFSTASSLGGGFQFVDVLFKIISRLRVPSTQQWLGVSTEMILSESKLSKGAPLGIPVTRNWRKYIF